MFTRTGEGLAVAAVVCCVGGWALGYVELVVFGVAAVVALAVAVAWVQLRPPLEVTRQIRPNRVPVGAVALGMVEVRNLGRRPTAAATARDRLAHRSVEVDLPRLRPGGRRAVPYELPTQRRAVLEVGPLELVRADPLGLVRRTRRCGATETLWVHPRLHPVSVVPSGRVRDLDGPSSDTSPNGTITFHALRSYERGDDLRLIHWRSSAKLGELLVRQQVDVSLPSTVVVLDTRAAAYPEPEAFEAAVEAAASVLVASAAKHYPTRLLTPCGVELTGRPGRETQDLLDELAGISLTQDESLEVVVRRLLGDRGGGSTLAIITGSPAAEDLRRLLGRRRRYEHVVVASLRPAGARDVAPVEGVLVVNASSGAGFAAAWNRGTAS